METMRMPIRTLALLCCTSLSSVTWAQVPGIRATVNFNDNLGPMKIDRFSLGQGGLSPEPMFANRTAEILALRPRTGVFRPAPEAW
jgi:hypothetical protein